MQFTVFRLVVCCYLATTVQAPIQRRTLRNPVYSCLAWPLYSAKSFGVHGREKGKFIEAKNTIITINIIVIETKEKTCWILGRLDPQRHTLKGVP